MPNTNNSFEKIEKVRELISNTKDETYEKKKKDDIIENVDLEKLE